MSSNDRKRMKTSTKKLKDLLEPAVAKGLKGSLNPTVLRLVIDSRRVTPGALFFALPGLKVDGNAFIDEAVSRGAVAVVSNQARKFPSAKVAYVTVQDPRAALAYAARQFYGCPDEVLDMVGVTGTNGKTTVSYLTQRFLSEGGKPFACLGTVGYDLVKRTVPSFRTTPESHELLELLSQVESFDCAGAVMEVSSHGIDQNRVQGIHFDVAAFLNLTRDHLDYHGEMEEYFAVKKRLFTGEVGPLPKVAAINADDPYGLLLAAELEGRMRVILFGTSEQAEVRAIDARLGAQGSTFTLLWKEGEAAVELPLIGAYNVSNASAAFAIAIALGRNPRDCIRSLASFAGIPGRMELVRGARDFSVVVDYAHTEDALRNALSMLREVTTGSLKVVFGCGGNRDRGKRPAMTKVALELADRCWATADNPRNESLDAIFEDMRTAVADGDAIEFIPDRRRAIELALKSCQPGDCLLIAGKGHESFQEFGETVVPFDDRKVAAELLENIRLGGLA